MHTFAVMNKAIGCMCPAFCSICDSSTVRGYLSHVDMPRADKQTHTQMGIHSGVKTSSKRPSVIKPDIYIGSWNVRSLVDKADAAERKTAMLGKELKRYKLDVVALSEVRLLDQGKLREPGSGYTFYWIGNKQGERKEHGVGFAVSDRLQSQITEEPNGINNRIITMRMRINRRTYATFISVYAPTMCYADVDKDSFYSQLSGVVRAVPANDRLFLLGDLNARVGRDAETWIKVLGPHGIGSMNTNGERLLTLCATHDLSITNTWFNVGESNIATWTHPRSGHSHLIDYVIIRQRDFSDVRITRAMRGADCNTDHALVRTIVRLRISKIRNGGRQRCTKKLDIQKLQEPAILESFQNAVEERLNESSNLESGIEMWQRIKESVSSAAIEALGYKKGKRPDWFDENDDVISMLIQQKNEAYAAVIQHPHDATMKQTLHNSRRMLTQRLRQIKNNWWVEQSKKMQTFADRRQSKEFFDSLKVIFGPAIRPVQTLVDRQTGDKLTKTTDVLATWKDHFSTLLNQPSTIDWDCLNNLPQQPIESAMDILPTMKEVCCAMSQLRNGKAAGQDGLPSELFKYGGEALAKEMLHLVHRIWEEEQIPQEFKDATIIPLYKGKGSRQKTDNYRGISLLCCASKIVTRLLLNRLNSHIMDQNLPEEQCGFRNGRSTIDMVFAARQIQEKCRERNHPLYAMFVDFTKAFDSVNREALWIVMGKFGCSRKFVNLVKSFHMGMKARVQACGATTEDFDIVTGVKQGCVLAPTLFNLYLTAMLVEAFRDSDDGVRVQYRFDGQLLNSRRFQAKGMLNEVIVRMLCFADDCALLARTEEELQRMSNMFSTVSAKFGLNINVGKTFVFYQPKPLEAEGMPTIKIGGCQIENRTEFNYLGSTLATDLTVDQEIRKRIALASVSFGRLEERVWRNRNLKICTKIAVYRAMVLSVLLYGSETWTLYRRNIKQMERFHLQCLRRILRVQWTDMIPNTEILTRAQIGGMESLIMHGQLRWLGHVRRMSSNRIPKQLLYGQLANGKRSMGHQKMRYRDNIQLGLRNAGINTQTWEDVAQNRCAWRSAIHTGTRGFEQNRLSSLRKKRAVRKGIVTETRSQTVYWQCDICGRQCASRLGLVSHKRTHTQPPSKRPCVD